MRSGITLACPTFSATAPASKFNHADDWFSRVTQTMPKSVSSSVLAILSFHRAPPSMLVSDIHGPNEQFPQCPVVLSSSLEESLFVDCPLTTVVGSHRQAELDQPIDYSPTNARYVDHRGDPVVPVHLVVDVAYRLGNMSRGCHRVGLMVRPVRPHPAAFTAHDHCLVLTKAEVSAAMSGRRVRGSICDCAASIHFGWIWVSSETSGNSPSTFDW